MSGGGNGLNPLVNLEERRKCPLHPTKARFSESEAEAEGKKRSKATKLTIEPYLCPGCGYWHLTKNSFGTPGKGGKYTVGEFQSPNHPVFANAPQDEIETDDEGLPIVPGDFDTRVRFAMALLEENPEPTSDELCEAMGGCTKGSLRKVMLHLGYRNTRGRNARWVKGRSAADLLREKNEQEAAAIDVPVIDRSTGQPVPEPDVPVTLRADYASPWTDLDPARIGHVAIGDLIATYAAAGLDVRIQIGHAPRPF